MASSDGCKVFIFAGEGIAFDVLTSDYLCGGHLSPSPWHQRMKVSHNFILPVEITVFSTKFWTWGTDSIRAWYRGCQGLFRCLDIRIFAESANKN